MERHRGRRRRRGDRDRRHAHLPRAPEPAHGKGAGRADGDRRSDDGTGDLHAAASSADRRPNLGANRCPDGSPYRATDRGADCASDHHADRGRHAGTDGYRHRGPRTGLVGGGAAGGTDGQALAGAEARFDASLKNGDDNLIEWRLGGETVGRGRTLVLGKELTATPGKKRLEIFAGRDRQRISLHYWEVQIEAPSLGFAGLEPASQTVERSYGARVSFRAPVKSAEGEKLAFLWEVNGKPARDADGPTYDFQPQGPGEYVVQVRATAPWGASIANKWTLSVRPPIPTPDLREEVAKADPRAEVQTWIEAYCAAFQKKDTDALIALGHLSSQSEATRLRDALSSMSDLKVSCSNPSVRVNGDQAVVSFDRIDRWTDPRGSPMERALPRITKNLRKNNGRWIAVP